ncbi:MAG: DUF2142 domain-containing protein [bacterium]
MTTDVIIALIILFVLIEINLWLLYLLLKKAASVSFRFLVIVIIATGLTCRITFSIFTPAFYAPDEHAHFNYVKYLADNRSLPVQTNNTDTSTHDYEYFQPPLYYLAMASVYWVTVQIFDSEAAAMYVMRLISILLWLANVWFTLKILQRLAITDFFAKSVVMSMVCLLPTYAFLSSAINNDNLLLALGSVFLFVVVQQCSTMKHAALAGTLLGLLLLTKLSAIVYVAFFVILTIVRLVREPQNKPAILGSHILTLMLAALIFAPWMARNVLVYGSLTALDAAIVQKEWPSLMVALQTTLEYMQRSFWAVSGVTNNVASIFPWLGRLVSYLAVGGLFYRSIRKRTILPQCGREHTGIFFAIALATIVNIALVFEYGILYDQGQGRFLFPSLIPVSLIFAYGLKAFAIVDSSNSHITCAGFFAVYLIAFMIYSLFAFWQFYLSSIF